MNGLDDRAGLLPAEPSSASRARRMTADALRTWGLDHLVDAATLLVSEVVTNAVLHAGTDLELRVTRTADGARFEVRDGSDVVPTVRNFDNEAATGRGLSILDAMASAWGVDRTDRGKVVWFSLGTASTSDSESTSAEPSAGPLSFTVRLRAVPVSLAKATIEQGEALLRELLLLTFDDSDAVIAPLTLPDLDLGPLLTMLDAAEADALAASDVELDLPSTAADAAIDRLALVEEADRLARDGSLLVPPTLPEVGQCRRWLLSEIAMQGRGEAPTPLDLDDVADADPVATAFGADDVAALGADAAASIVADAENRIVFVGNDAAAALGWTTAELTGRRLTTIVPPQLREAHVVGFTRHQLSGESRILGAPVRIMALAGDGGLVDVELRIRPLADRRYHAVIRRA